MLDMGVEQKRTIEHSEKTRGLLDDFPTVSCLHVAFWYVPHERLQAAERQSRFWDSNFCEIWHFEHKPTKY